MPIYILQTTQLKRHRYIILITFRLCLPRWGYQTLSTINATNILKVAQSKQGVAASQ